MRIDERLTHKYCIGLRGKLLNDSGETLGTWTVNGTSLCQESYERAYAVRLEPSFIPASDYQVETRVTVQGIDPSLPTGDSPGIGLELRVTGLGGATAGYDCHVDPAEYCMNIGEWSPVWQSLAGECTEPTTVASHHLRAAAVGGDLLCEHLSWSLSLTQGNATAHPQGTVGFFAYHTKVCLEYLLVIKAP